ncbi:putative SOUL hem-binding protein [Helianthus debilis subsp. tardiflorus]
MVSLTLMLIVTKVAKSALEKALAEGADIGGSGAESSSAVEEARVDIHDPLLVKVPDLETGKFKVLSRNDQYEIRELEPYFVVETTMPGKYGFDLNGSSQSFNVLAEYLFGKAFNISSENTANEAMEMTPPVLTRRTQSGGETMDMTTPVITKRMDDQDKWKMSFVMPSKYGSNLPLPKNSSVTINEVPAKTVAVVSFLG